MKPSESTGNAVESLKVHSEGLSREQLDPAGRKLPVFPRKSTLRLLVWVPEPNPRGSQRSQLLEARFQAGRHLLGNRPPATGVRSSLPSQTPSRPMHTPSPSLPKGRMVPLTSSELAGVPAAHPAHGTGRAHGHPPRVRR